MIKCEDFACIYYREKNKQACSRQADPHTCKGYLNTIISVQQRTIDNMKIESVEHTVKELRSLQKEFNNDAEEGGDTERICYNDCSKKIDIFIAVLRGTSGIVNDDLSRNK